MTLSNRLVLLVGMSLSVIAFVGILVLMSNANTVVRDAFRGSTDVGLPTDVRLWHDDTRGVTCYILSQFAYGDGWSCIPDSQLKPQP